MGNREQRLLRQLKFVAEMKLGNYPNAQSMAREFERYEDEDGEPMGCSPRTVMRDINHLLELGAPIEYDPTNKGYYLRHKSWEFKVPVFQEDFVSMAMLGTRLAEDIVPEPLKTDIDGAIVQALATNSSEFFDAAMIDSILCASGMKAAINPEIFKKLFDAWRRKRMVTIRYRDPQGKETESDFEPHLIVFHKGLWYAKGYIYNTKNLRIYACQRILSVTSNPQGFETDRKLIDDTRRKGLFNYPKVEGIRLHCDASIAFYIYEQQKVFKSKIERQEDGSLVVALNPTVEHDVIRWILAEAGRIQVLEPKALREKIAEAGRNITRNNS